MIIARPVPIGTFSFCVPLKHLFGFCDDYNNIIYGVKQTLLLSRQTDADAIYCDGVAVAGQIMLTKLSWIILHVIPSLEYKSVLMRQIATK